MPAESLPPVVVTVSRDMADLLPIFLAQRKADQVALAVALPARQFDVIRRIGHGMTGSGTSYGFDALTDLGERIVLAARAGDVATLGQLQHALDDYLARLHVKYV